MTNPTTCPGCGQQTESSLPACQFCNFRWAVLRADAPHASAGRASAPDALTLDDATLEQYEREYVLLGSGEESDVNLYRFMGLIREVRRLRARLTAEVAALCADRDRLDWLAGTLHGSAGSIRFFRWALRPNAVERAAELREAIDYARENLKYESAAARQPDAQDASEARG